MRIRYLLPVVIPVTLSLGQPVGDGNWPREIDTGSIHLVIYQPQVDRWEGNRIESRSAVIVTRRGDPTQIFGTVSIQARTEVDRETRLVSFEDISIKQADFPSAVSLQPTLLKAVRESVPSWPRTVSLDRLLADPALVATLKWPHTAPDAVERGYKLIASGLRANAHLALGELDPAARALEIRAQLAEARLAKSGLDEHLRALALVEARLGDVARDRKKPDEAARWLSAALDHADQYLQKTGVPLTADQLDVLRLGAELALATGQKLKQELPARVKQAFDKLVSERDPAFRAHERWFEVYLALLTSAPSHSAASDNPATMAR